MIAMADRCGISVGELSAIEYALLLEKCKALPPARGTYAVQSFISNLMLTVLDYQLQNVIVDRAHVHFLRWHAERIRTIGNLEEFLSRYSDDRQGNTDAAVALWGYKHWTRLAQLRRLVAYFQSIGVIDAETLRRWAEQALYDRDFKGKVKGLGPAVFQWLVMRSGVETVKPDVHIMKFMASVLGYEPAFDVVVRALESISRAIGRRPRELDLSIWEYQRGGPGVI
jgi:hypothetical protein